MSLRPVHIKPVWLEFQIKFLFCLIESKLEIYESKKISSSQNDENGTEPWPYLKCMIYRVCISAYNVLWEVICA